VIPSFESIAEVINILSSHIAGVELPEPGNATFHLIFFSFVKLDGNFSLSANPLPVGPLQAGQLAPTNCDTKAKTQNIEIEKVFIIIQIINNQQI